MAATGPLAGVRVLDLTDETAIYGAKLLADLGALVLRPEPSGGDPLRQRGPFDGETSLWYAFFTTNRHFVEVDDTGRLADIASRSDIVLVSRDGLMVSALDLAKLQEENEDLIIIRTTPFGTEGPWNDFLAPDLVAGALGGLVATTGVPETPPLKCFGELNFMVSGTYAAIAALSALFRRQQDGLGQTADVSVHESIASCLEQVLMFYWYHETLNRDPVLPRRGAVHWSNAYVVFPAKDGGIMVTPAPDFDRQLVWLIEEDVAEDLIDPKYNEPEHLAERIAKTMDIMRRWVATKSAESLFFEAQSRHAPYGWVIPFARLPENPQLEARQWFEQYHVGDSEVRGPGTPYVFSKTPWSVNPVGAKAAPVADVLAEIGWESQS